MNIPRLLLLGIVGFVLACFAAPSGFGQDKPNIVFVLCDDLGFGDVGCNNPEGKIKTPVMDKVAREGMRFTDAHTSSSVCTPTRYGLLTGRYNWRTRLQNGVLGGLSPHLIDPQRTTVASLLKANGYATACIGKWHLGMDWVVRPGQTISELSIEKPDQVNSVDFTQPIKLGPNSYGFDYYFGISASLDMVPYAYIENDRVTAQPTEEREFPLVLDAENKRMTRRGPAAPGFEAEAVLPTLADKAVEWISSKTAEARQGKPFFVYLPLTSPHSPIVPTREYQGKSGVGVFGDFVVQTDAAIGKVVAALERGGVAENTLIIITSDNGCSPIANFETLQAHGHDPGAGLRGNKADVYEGGHRVPFLVRWPAKVKAGTESSALVCLTDFMATCADLLGAKLPDNAAEDSISFLPVLREERQTTRTTLVSHSINGSFAIRDGNMKLCLCPGSGGWSAPRPGSQAEKGLPDVQLYDLQADRGEKTNLAATQPETVQRLTRLLQTYVDDGRSTPGAAQKNDAEVQLVKKAKAR